MRSFLTAAATILIVPVTVVSAATPAAAISADLAKKCRQMAIKAHPPPVPLGNEAYAQAQREFFRECVAKNGEVPITDAAKPPTDQK